MADLIGLLSIQIVFIITFLIARKWPDISKIIFSAFSLRVFLMLIGHYFISLPDSTKDAMGFEWGTWNRAKDGFINVLYNYPGMSMEFYQWLMAFPYSLFGRSILMLQSISLLFGLGCILLGWLLAKKNLGQRYSNKSWLDNGFISNFSIILNINPSRGLRVFFSFSGDARYLQLE